MVFIVWLLVGGAAGGIVGFATRSGIATNVLIGMVGAVISGAVIGPWLGAPSTNAGINLVNVLFSLVGALTLLTINNFLSPSKPDV